MITAGVTMLAKTSVELPENEYRCIMEFANGLPNDETYACMLSSWKTGMGVMPDYFGLGKAVFKELLMSHFPGITIESFESCGRIYDEQRNEECDQVCELLLSHCAGQSESEIWMARIVAVACQGQDHLWQDMGLWSRSQLSDLLMRNFPRLASMNVNNMKWKKFIYKQLCITEGIYICRAPSCEVCIDYDNCFSSED